MLRQLLKGGTNAIIMIRVSNVLKACWLIVLLTSINLNAWTATSDYLELPLFFSSNMVLQRDVPLKFWGWASPGETVNIALSIQNKEIQTSVVAGADGKWTGYLPAQPVTVEPCELRFSLQGYPETLQVLTNVLVGDVWLAAGQSNMEKKVNHLLEADEYIREANNYSLIRSFKTTYNAATEPQEKVKTTSLPWFVCNSQLVGDNVSAVAYVFARYIQEELKIPIGIIQSYRGGTEIETWISPKQYSNAQYCKIAGRKEFLEELNPSNSHSVNYNGQIHPLTGFPMKGFVWYQGESNTKRAKEYRYMMKMLIEDWRSLWGHGELPFYYVQMYNYSTPAIYDEYNWVDLREQQEFLLYDKTVSNTGMAVIIDTNEEATNPDVNVRAHPRNKKPIGERLARIALKETYGNDMLSEGPVVNRFRFSNDSVYLYYRNYGDGLRIKSDESNLNGFILSGNDMSFKPAKAEIINDSTVAVTSSLVPQPVAVRYAWARNPICNLYNSVDIPAMPFRSDMWTSKATYSQFKTSCDKPDDDASLVSIRLNGVPVENFNPAQFKYNVASGAEKNFPVVHAVPNSPWTQIKVTEDNLTQRVIITVTAESGLVQQYEIDLYAVSSVDKTNEQNRLTFFQQNASLIILNNNAEKIDVEVFNSQGQCVLKDELQQYEQRALPAIPGIYLLSMFFGKYKSKFLMK